MTRFARELRATVRESLRRFRGLTVTPRLRARMVRAMRRAVLHLLLAPRRTVDHGRIRVVSDVHAVDFIRAKAGPNRGQRVKRRRAKGAVS